MLLLRDLTDGHREAIQPVLEGHGLAVLVELADGTLDGLGRPESTEELLEELVTLRLAARRASGVVALVTA